MHSVAVLTPVTPVRRRKSSVCVNPAETSALTWINPRKRRLPDSPIKPAFSLGSPRTPARRGSTQETGFASCHLPLTWASTSGTAHLFDAADPTPAPSGPLLPSAPVFEDLPLPPLTPTSETPSVSTSRRPSLCSSPMKRSPAMRDLAAFTREAYAAETAQDRFDEARWEGASISRFELGVGRSFGFARPGAPRGLVPCDDDPFSASFVGTSPTAAVRLDFGEFHPSGSFECASSPSTPSLSPCSSATTLSPISSAVASPTAAERLRSSPLPLPLGPLSLSPSSWSGDFFREGETSAVAEAGSFEWPSPSGLALRRLNTLEQRRGLERGRAKPNPGAAVGALEPDLLLREPPAGAEAVELIGLGLVL